MAKNYKQEIFLEELPRWKNGAYNGKIHWEKTIGCRVNFIYDDIEGEIEIVDYNKKKHQLTVKYNNTSHIISNDNLIKCQIGRIISKITSDFKIEIGIIIKDNNRDLIIINREHRPKYNKNGILIQNEKWYKYHCNKDNYEDWVIEGNLIGRQASGCSCCSNNIIVEGINDIPTTTPWLIPYFQGGYDEAKLYGVGSDKTIIPICPYCKRTKKNKMRINTIYKQHSIGCSCSDKTPYTEKVMFNILNQFKLEFKTQLTKTTFKWCDRYKYDFYFEYDNEQYICEVHGIQHYEQTNRKGARTLEEEVANDKLKKKLALANGIKPKNYIVIDFRKSELEWIRDNENGILNSRLAEIFNLSKIDWNKVQEFACSNLVYKVCELRKNNPNIGVEKISKLMNMSITPITNYLKRGNELAWCEYNPKDEQRKSGSISGKLKNKPVEIFKEGVPLGVFNSCVELSKQSLELFGIKLDYRNISSVCTNKQKTHQGFTFKYIPKEEYELLKLQQQTLNQAI